MRFRIAACAALALALSLSVAADVRADNLLTRWFARPKKKEPEKPAPPSEETERAKQDRARKEWAERAALVLKLKEIGERTNNHELIRQAETLDERVWETYRRRLGISDRTLEEDERLLSEQVDRQRDTRDGGTPPLPKGQASLRGN